MQVRIRQCRSGRGPSKLRINKTRRDRESLGAVAGVDADVLRG